VIDLKDLSELSQDELIARARENPAWFRTVLMQTTQALQEDRKGTQLAYYQVRNPDALKAHTSMKREVAIVGGNRSSKTDTMLAELAIQATGHIPVSLMGTYPREKIRAPIRARLVCNSLTDTIEPVIKPKLRWDQWNGVGDPNDGRGHWGWIPRHCLAGGSWEKAYSERYRTLHVSVDSYWRGADGSINSVSGTSTIQLMSYDQDLSAFAGSSLHWVGHDELPPSDIYRENRLRTLDVRGQLYTAFTPPDEAGSAQVDAAWFFDEIYEPGLPGPNQHPEIDTIQLFTERNTILSPEDVQAIAERLTDEQRAVRLYGRFIHLSGVVYSMFERTYATWCYRCQKRVLGIDGSCPTCKGDDLSQFSHVIEPFPIPAGWPVVMVIDPHPRKADAIGWFAVAPSDDVFMVGELEATGTAKDVAREIRSFEERHRMRPVKRLMDPNIATETNDRMQRGWTIRKEYDQEGIRCDLANDEINAGISQVNELLRPDPRTRRPRFAVFNTCPKFIYGMTHWTWDEWTRGGDKEPKEKVRDRHKDFPDLVRYFALDRPSFTGYTRGMVFQHRRRG